MANSRQTRGFVSWFGGFSPWCILLALCGALEGGAAGSEPFRPDARALFAGCTPFAASGSSRGYGCPGKEASFTYLDAELHRSSDDEILSLGRRGLNDALPRGWSEKRVTLKLAGRELPTLSFTARAPGSQRVTHAGYFALDRVAAGEVRAYMCIARPGEGAHSAECMRMLEYFAKRGVPEPIEWKKIPRTRSLRLLSREVRLPSQCRNESPNPTETRIVCPDGLVSWSISSPGGEPRKMNRMAADIMREGISISLSERPLECTVEKLPGACALLSGQAPDGRRVSIYIGSTRTEQQGLTVTCIQPRSSGALPSLCRDILEFPPSAPGSATPRRP